MSLELSILAFGSRLDMPVESQLSILSTLALSIALGSDVRCGLEAYALGSACVGSEMARFLSVPGL